MQVRGNSASSRDKAHHLHPMTNLKKHEEAGPMIITGGNGIYVTDDTGKEYIEGLAGLWCASLGFSEERLVEAATRQMRALPYYQSFNHKAHGPVIDLAEKLIEIAPAPMSKVFFANSGSEANDTAVKLVWYYNNAIGRPEKKKIIARNKGYHGVTVAAASLTGLPHMHTAFDLPIAGILRTDCAHHYRFAEEGESEEQFASRLADNLEKLVIQEGPETVAAFIAEPVMGAGGATPPPSTYFEKIQKVLKKYDILFIADEVICGFGRTGNMFGSQTYGIRPDILTCAKALSSAYLPISAVMISEEIYQGISKKSDEIGTFGHGYTYSGHPVCAAVALETLKIYDERGIIEHVQSVAPRLQEGLRRFRDHPLVGEVRGVGLVGAIELVANKQTKQSFDAKQAVGVHLQGRAQEHGLIIRALGDSIAFCPPLIITGEQIDEMLARFGKALEETTAMISESKLDKVA